MLDEVERKQVEIVLVRNRRQVIGWTGDTQVLHEITENDESGVQESP